VTKVSIERTNEESVNEAVQRIRKCIGSGGNPLIRGGPVGAPKGMLRAIATANGLNWHCGTGAPYVIGVIADVVAGGKFAWAPGGLSDKESMTIETLASRPEGLDVFYSAGRNWLEGLAEDGGSMVVMDVLGYDSAERLHTLAEFLRTRSLGGLDIPDGVHFVGISECDEGYDRMKQKAPELLECFTECDLSDLFTAVSTEMVMTPHRDWRTGISGDLAL